MKINFGCGDNPGKGFVGCDIRPLPNVKYVCNAWRIIEFVKPETVEVISSRHFLEHLIPYHADLTLMAWYKILKPGGIVHCEVPDLMYHCKQYLDIKNRQKQSQLNGPKTNIQHAMAGFYGWQRGEKGDIWDLHKWGYDFDILKELFQKHNFKNIKRINNKKIWNLIIETNK